MLVMLVKLVQAVLQALALVALAMQVVLQVLEVLVRVLLAPVMLVVLEVPDVVVTLPLLLSPVVRTVPAVRPFLFFSPSSSSSSPVGVEPLAVLFSRCAGCGPASQLV